MVTEKMFYRFVSRAQGGESKSFPFLEVGVFESI